MAEANSPKPLKIAMLIPDNREESGRHQDPLPYFGPAPSALLQGLAGLPDVEVHVVSCVKKAVPAPEKIAENTYYHAEVVPQWGWLRSGYLGCHRAVKNRLRTIRPHVVHGQGSERNCALNAACCGWPNVVTLHGNMRAVARFHHARPLSYLWLTARLEAMALRRTDGVVCITTYTRRQVAGLAKSTWVIPNAVDEDFFTVPRVAAREPVLLCVANIERHKNQVALMRALEPLAGRPPFRLKFLGRLADPDYGREFQNEIARLPWCEYAGYADRAMLKAELSCASLTVLPSLEDNCPMAVLEAMAAGVPVAAASIGGIPDLVVDGATGRLFNPGDPGNMREAVRELLENADRRQALAQAARQAAAERFRPSVIAQRHLEVYREVLRARSR